MARRHYFPHVEGLRGVAAGYVFLYHAWQTGIAHAHATMRVLLPYTLAWAQYGHYAVAVFIVISGYCLGLPVATRPDRPFGALEFAKRRARRLGPAYVAALLLSVVPYCAGSLLAGHRLNVAHVAVGLALHLALVHNLIASAAEYLNGPMWSIALECQIYVVFALLLVPVWRRFGVWQQLALALGLGLAPHLLFNGRFDYAAPWLLGLFAMGVAAAHASARGSSSRVPWGWLTAAATAVALALALPRGDAAADDALWLPDLAVGAGVALLFVWSGGAVAPWPARILAFRPLVALGAFSYSLYLIHGPLVVLLGAILWRANAGTMGSALAYGFLVPVVVALAYAFHRAFERPFMSAALQAAIQASTTASGDDPHARPAGQDAAAAPAYESR
jgi:peptidoglycan/LPS O-acetylase OafA/YrhL